MGAQAWSWRVGFFDDGRPSLVIETSPSAAHASWGWPERGLYWLAKAYTFDYDARGELATVTRHIGTRDFAEGGDAEDAQSAGVCPMKCVWCVVTQPRRCDAVTA